MTGGDFVRNVKQVIDLLRQVADVAPSPLRRGGARPGGRRLSPGRGGGVEHRHRHRPLIRGEEAGQRSPGARGTPASHRRTSGRHGDAGRGGGGPARRRGCCLGARAGRDLARAVGLGTDRGGNDAPRCRWTCCAPTAAWLPST